MLLLAALTGAATFAYRYLSFVDFTNDHFVHLSMAQQITMGAWPVRDFVERGLPLMSLTSAAGQAAFGPGLRSELIVVCCGFALAAAFTLLCTFAVSRSMVIAAGLTAATVVVFPATYSYPKLLLYALALLAGVAYGTSPTPLRAAAFGASAGLAFLFRHDHGVIIAAAVPVLMFARHGFSQAAVRMSGVAAGTALLVAAPYLAWVQVEEGLATYFRDGLLFSAREAERGTWGELPRFSLDRSKPMWVRLGHGPIVHVRWQPGLPDPIIRRGEERHGLRRLDLVGPLSWQYELRSWWSWSLKSLVRDPLVADTDGIDRSEFRMRVPTPPLVDRFLVHLHGPGDGMRARSNAVGAWFYLVWLLPLAATVALAVRWRQWPDAVRSTVAIAVALQLAMNLTMLRDPLDTRIRDVVVPAATLLSFLLALLWHARTHVAVRTGARALITMVIALVIVASGSIGEASTRLERAEIKRGWPGARHRLQELRSQLAPPRQRLGRVSPLYASLTDYIDACTTPASRILALTFAPEVFFYSGRGFAGGQVTMTPGYYRSERHASLMLARLRREQVPLVLLDSETEKEMESGYPRIMGLVRTRYHEISRMRVGPGKDFILLGENNRRVLRTFGPARLPCYAGAAG